MLYKADIAGGSLKLHESRIVADLLIRKVSIAEWKYAIETDNILQKTSIATAKRQASLIKKRLQTMTSEHWTIVRDGNKQLAIEALFAAAIKHSQLLQDFLDIEIRDFFRTGEARLTRSLWRNYVDRCRERDPDMSIWTQSTTDKLGDSAFQILTEVGLLSTGTKLVLQSVYYQTEIMDYLKARDCNNVIRAMQPFI